MTTDTQIELNQVDMVFFKEHSLLQVLDQVNLTVKEGEIVGLLGPSGSGKSTILNIISGLLTPTRGNCTVHGKVGYMFQQDHLLNWRTIYQNICLGLEIQKTLTPQALANAEHLLKTYDLWEFHDRYPRELSGGMRQRVALIRTLATNPNILLLDEPFSALDFQTRLMVSDDIYRIIKLEGKTTVLVTHDISEAIGMCDRIYVLSTRPATVKNVHTIQLSLEGEKTPFTARKAPEFQAYFDTVWKEMVPDEQ